MTSLCKWNNTSQPKNSSVLLAVMEPVWDLLFAVNLLVPDVTSSFSDVNIEDVFLSANDVRDESVANVWDMKDGNVSIFKSDRVNTWQYVTHVSFYVIMTSWDHYLFL